LLRRYGGELGRDNNWFNKRYPTAMLSGLQARAEPKDKDDEPKKVKDPFPKAKGKNKEILPSEPLPKEDKEPAKKPGKNKLMRRMKPQNKTLKYHY